MLKRNFHVLLAKNSLALWLLLAASFMKPKQSSAAASSNNNNYDGAILVLGDSWASVSGSYLSTVCTLQGGGSSSPPYFGVTNNGISGSTASQWASNNYATKSFNDGKHDYDYVWLSIGGNDFNCDESYHDTIASNIVSVISDIVSSSSNEDIKILFTGYGYPSSNICGNSNGSNDFLTIFEDFSETVRGTIDNSEYADRVYTMDISTLYVTNTSYPLSDTYYYADSIHINGNGYHKLFSMDGVQEFFGCDRYAYNTRDDDGMSYSIGDSAWDGHNWLSGSGGDSSYTHSEENLNPDSTSPSAISTPLMVAIIIIAALLAFLSGVLFLANNNKKKKRSNVNAPAGLSGTLLTHDHKEEASVGCESSTIKQDNGQTAQHTKSNVVTTSNA